jgi:hypothetical protein
MALANLHGAPGRAGRVYAAQSDDDVGAAAVAYDHPNGIRLIRHL